MGNLKAAQRDRSNRDSKSHLQKKKHRILIGCIDHPWLIFRDADQNNEFMINRQNIGILNIGTLDTAIWGICLMPSVDMRKPKAICQVA